MTRAKLTFLLTVAALVLAVLASSWTELSKLNLTKIPSRASWQLPAEVIAALGLSEGDQVADVGAGDGYFTFPLADAVGATGRVYAVEVEDNLVAALERQIQLRDVANVDAVLAELDDPRLPDGGVDLVFLCNTYHHIDDRTAYFSRLRTDLRPGGRVAILDMRADLTGIARAFATPGHWTARLDLYGEMELAGFRHVERHDFLPVQIFEVFIPAE